MGFKPGNQAAKGRRQPHALRRSHALMAMEEAILEWESERVIAARKRLQEESLYEMTDEEVAEAIPHEGTMHDALKSFFKLVLKHASFGDATATKMMMDRLSPKGKLPLVQLGNVASMSPELAAGEVAKAMARGGISPDTAKACVEVFMIQAEIAHYQAETRLANAMAKAEEALNLKDEN